MSIITELQNSLFLYENILSELPTNVYWKDVNSVYMGCNDRLAHVLGLPSRLAIQGMTDFDFNWGDSKAAESFIAFDQKVMKTEQSLSTEDVFKEASGKLVTVLTNKTPLKDREGKVIGVLAISVDITERKKMEADLQKAKETAESALQAMKKAQIKEQKHRNEAKRLEIENATHKIELESKAEGLRIANQVYHDINTPLTTLRTLEAHLNKLPEEKRIREEYRISLRNAIGRIFDTTSNLLNLYQDKDQGGPSASEEKHVVLLSAALLESLSEKKLQYENQSMQFTYEFTQNGQFAFINVQLSSLKRAISNVMNNAVQALEGQSGVVTLKLDADNEQVTIIIEDTGKGMTQAMIDKIMNNVAFTAGKAEGHGIGLGQVYDTLKRNFGTLTIQSKLKQGTQFIFSFPRHPAPGWCIETIQVSPDALVVIVDDDPSIHGAWDMRFAPIKMEAKDLQIHHFEQASNAIDFIASLNSNDKNRLLLLTDLELLNQHQNGFDVIKATKAKHAILVTSHYAQADVQEKTVLEGATLLPKQLVSEIPIIATVVTQQPREGELKVVNAVWLEDNQDLINIQSLYFKKGDKVDIYKNPQEFLQTVQIYPKNTAIFLDNHFEPPFKTFRGIDIAAQLHAQGFTKLFLLSGQLFGEGEVPKYVTVISKGGAINLRDYW